ncbi:MAG TPA: LLM class flavin-dependent oxidoreductase [Solirubrobacteraceae bacterium]|nr:LLM class flavin-dependent oxidoreductase [Solirubrobacteraceae bacterium]
MWRDSPATHDGRHYRFEDIYLEPKPYRADGPTPWFGGMTVGPRIVRRLVEYGRGFHPFGQPTAEELRPLVDAMAAAGRDYDELEVVGGIRGRFRDATGVADLARAARSIPAQLEAGYTTICFKPPRSTPTTRRRSDGCAASLWSQSENSAVRSHTVFTSA